MANTLKSKILDILHKDCRISNEEIAKMIGSTTEEVAALIAELESEGVILGYGAKVNWDKAYGPDSVTAYIELRVTPMESLGFDRIAERIYQYPEVKSINLMSGSYDFGITIEGSNIREISSFISEHLATMNSVVGTATHFVLKRYKFDGVVCDLPENDDREVISL